GRRAPRPCEAARRRSRGFRRTSRPRRARARARTGGAHARGAMRRRVPVRPRRSRTPRRRRVRASAVSLVVDTGPLVALLDADDQDHASCSELLRSWTGVRLVPSPVLVELDHFVPTRALVAFVQGVQRGAFVIEDLQPRDYARVGELLE